MPLSHDETRLYAALSEYLGLIRSGRAGSAEPASAEALLFVSQKLDSLSAELASRVDPRLAHFLESKSYRKAYEFLSALSPSGLANSATPRQPCSR